MLFLDHVSTLDHALSYWHIILKLVKFLVNELTIVVGMCYINFEILEKCLYITNYTYSVCIGIIPLMYWTTLPTHLCHMLRLNVNDDHYYYYSKLLNYKHMVSIPIMRGAFIHTRAQIPIWPFKSIVKFCYYMWILIYIMYQKSNLYFMKHNLIYSD